VGANHYGQISPEEPRLGADGAVYVQTLGCGIERITDIASDEPKSKLVWTFPGSFCGVPTIVGHFLMQSVPAMHGLIVLDISNGAKPVEVSRLKLSDNYFPHWTSWDEKTRRLVVTGSENRLYLLKLDEATARWPSTRPSMTRTASPDSTSPIESGRKAGRVPAYPTAWFFPAKVYKRAKSLVCISVAR